MQIENWKLLRQPASEVCGSFVLPVSVTSFFNDCKTTKCLWVESSRAKLILFLPTLFVQLFYFCAWKSTTTTRARANSQWPIVILKDEEFLWWFKASWWWWWQWWSIYTLSSCVVVVSAVVALSIVVVDVVLVVDELTSIVNNYDNCGQLQTIEYLNWELCAYAACANFDARLV